MKLTLLSQYFPPDMGAGSNRVFALMKSALRMGHRVQVITAFPHYPDGVLKNHGKVFYHAYLSPRVPIYRAWLFSKRHMNLPERLFNQCSFLITALWVALRRVDAYNTDYLIISSPPLFIGLIGVVLKRLRGVPFVFDVRDIIPDYWVTSGVLPGESPFVRLCQRIEGLIYQEARLILTVSHAKRQRLMALGVPAEKLVLVENGVELEAVLENTTERDDSRNHSLKAALGIPPEAFVCSHIGLLGKLQKLDTLLEAAELLVDEDIHFLVIGDGPERAGLEARSQGLKIHFVGPKPRKNLEHYYRITDVCLSLTRQGLTDMVPIKIYEAFAHGKPVCAAVAGEAAEVVERSGAGRVAEPENADDLARQILMLRHWPEPERRRMGEQGQLFVKQHHLREKIFDAFFTSFCRKTAVGLRDEAGPLRA